MIVKGNRILSSGYNEIRYSAELRKGTVHAEEAAIIKLLKARNHVGLSGSDIYVVRTLRSGGYGSSRPCPSCARLIKSVGIREVFYTDELGEVQSYRC